MTRNEVIAELQNELEWRDADQLDIFNKMFDMLVDARLSSTEGWREFPAEKPEKEGEYLVTYIGKTAKGFWVEDKWWSATRDSYPFVASQITAFQNLPAPFKKAEGKL